MFGKGGVNGVVWRHWGDAVMGGAGGRWDGWGGGGVTGVWRFGAFSCLSVFHTAPHLITSRISPQAQTHPDTATSTHSATH